MIRSCAIPHLRNRRRWHEGFCFPFTLIKSRLFDHATLLQESLPVWFDIFGKRVSEVVTLTRGFLRRKRSLMNKRKVVRCESGKVLFEIQTVRCRCTLDKLSEQTSIIIDSFNIWYLISSNLDIDTCNKASLYVHTVFSIQDCMILIVTCHVNEIISGPHRGRKTMIDLCHFGLMKTSKMSCCTIIRAFDRLYK